MAHPRYREGERLHFSYQYGATTSWDAKGMPRTASDHDTVIRVDRDPWGPHIYYQGRNHIKQEDLGGSFIIDNAEVFEFIDAVQTQRQSRCEMHDVLLFTVKGGKR